MENGKGNKVKVTWVESVVYSMDVDVDTSELDALEDTWWHVVQEQVEGCMCDHVKEVESRHLLGLSALKKG